MPGTDNEPVNPSATAERLFFLTHKYIKEETPMSKAQATAKTPRESVQTTAEQPLPMKVDVKIGSIRPEGNVRAYVPYSSSRIRAIIPDV